MFLNLRHQHYYALSWLFHSAQKNPGLETGLALGALEKALLRGTPQIHHSDQGVQYASAAYTARLGEVKAQISMAEVGESAPQWLRRACPSHHQRGRGLPQ
jgi:transposase InsO family protein